MTDEEIVQLFFQRKEEAVQEINRKYGSYCFKIANNILNNREDSEECVNDTWMQTWNTIPPTRPKYLRLFVAKIVRNLSFSRFKLKNAKKRGSGEMMLVLEELEECIAGQSDVETLYIAGELQTAINEFVNNLPEKEGNIFIRRYFYAESMKDISRRYAVSENNVRVILSRTRAKLRVKLKKEGYIS